jgi:hypothetical protein
MGGSSSKSTTTNTYNTTVVNNNDLELLNKSVNDFVSNTVVNQASNCSANITQLQSVNITDINAKGDVVLGGVNQNQSSAITFDCVQLSSFQNDIANGVLSQYMNAIENSYNSSSLATMTAAAQASAQNQFGTSSSSNSNSSSNNNYNFKSVTNTHQNIQNVVENAITNNMSMTDVQSCMASVSSSQSVNYSRINTGGSLTVQPISQNQAADLMAKCVQEKNNGNKISNQIAANLGLTVVTESTTTSAAEMSGTAKSESTNTGVFQSMGQGLSSVLQGFGSMWSSIIGSFGFGDPTISMYCCIAIIVLAVLGGIGYYFYQQQQNGDTGGDDMGDQFGGAKFDTLKFVVLIMLFLIIMQIYSKQN